MKTKREKGNKSSRSGVKNFAVKYWFLGFAVLFYTFFAAYYKGPSFFHCTDRLYGIGDSSAGPVWENSLKPTFPIAGGYENVTNYPGGENLYSPVKYSVIAQTIPMRVASKVVGPVCSYNLFNIVGYLTTALVMMGFIYYLTRSRWIALLAGYVVTYSPYFQSKPGGHPSYGFTSLIIAALWLTLLTLQRRRLRYGLGLALILAVCAYFDPYFILLSGTVVGPTLGIWAIYSVFKGWRSTEARREALATLKVLAISFGLFVVMLLPLAYIRIHDAAAIENTTSSVRGDVKVTAQQCSNMPLDYLLPDPNNQFFVDHVFHFTQRNVLHRHWCGFGESRVAVSLTAIATILLASILLVWEWLNKRRLKISEAVNYNPALLFWVLLTVGLAAFSLGLPPHIGKLITPSDVVLHLTSTWRIFAREYLVVNFIVITVFALALKFFSAADIKWKKVLLPVLYVLLFLGIVVEYQVTTPFLPLTFSYSQDTPSIYKQIRDDNDIQAIAEYPIDRLGLENDSVVYYLTMQTVHQKKLFNSASGTDSRMAIHLSVRDLSDPQTLPALRYMGIHYVVVHDVTKDELQEKTPDLQIIGESNPLIYGLTMVREGKSNQMYLTKIKDGPTLDHVLTIQKGYAVNLPLQKDPLNGEFEVLQNTELEVVPLSGKKNQQAVPVCFEAKMSAKGDSGNLTVKVNGVDSITLPVTDQFTAVQLSAKEGDKIVLHTSNGYNMRLNNLGCK